jgi:antitoxin ParD1/3/4
MRIRNIVLSERQIILIEALVQSGRYQSASDVLREGLRLVENHETSEEKKMDALRAAAQVGISAVDRGEFKEFADAAALIGHLTYHADDVLSSTAGK